MSGQGAAILIVEDDDATRNELVRNMAAHGYRTDEAPNAAEALRRWGISRPDVVLLDLGLPDRDGLTVVRQVRRDGTTPIVIVSARDDEATKVEALERGADDYITKPFGMPELHARIRAVLRRAAGPAADATGIVRNGTLEVDVAGHAARVAGIAVPLTPREFQILAVLVGSSGRLVTRGRLLRAVWGEAYAGEDHYLHVYVSQIRRKIATADPDGSLRDLIAAEPGVGYRVRPT